MSAPSRPGTQCENFLYGFQGGPPGRSRRRHGAHAYAPAGAPATAALTPGGWRESIRLAGRYQPTAVSRSSTAGVSMLPLRNCPGQVKPVKVFCGRRATAPVELRGARTREDDLDWILPCQGDGSDRKHGREWPGRFGT